MLILFIKDHKLKHKIKILLKFTNQFSTFIYKFLKHSSNEINPNFHNSRAAYENNPVIGDRGIRAIIQIAR